NTVNSGVTIPSPGTLTGFIWSYNNVVTSTNNVDTVVGPFTISGRYEYVASYNTPCGILQDTAVIDVLLPLVISDDTTICQGESVDLTVEFPGTGPWTIVVSDGGPTDTITGIAGLTFTHTDTPMVTTTYYVHSYWGTNNFIVDNFDSATVTVILTPLVDLGPDQTICEGDSITLSAAGPVATDLVFSEYGEGSSNNKAIELFNGTSDTIDLANYRINQSVNGGGWQYEHYFPAGAKLNPGQIWVMVADQMSSAYFDIALADEVLSYPSVVHHNGDDARGLEVTTDSGTTWTLIDIIGDPDNDPGTGWDVAGVSAATANHTLIRKPEVLAPNTDWLVVAGTDPASSEYIVHPVNYYDNLGMHTMNIDFGVGNTYLWSNGDSTESITVMPTTTTTYSVTVTNATGCYSVDSVTIHVNPTPVVNLGPNTTFCNTESLTLDAGAGFASYLWSDLSTGQTLVLDSFNLTVGTHTISVTVTDTNGCEGVGSVEITMADCTGLNNLSLSKALKFYPNPNTGNFFMEVNGINGEMIIRMTNTTGHMIYNETINVTGQMMKELHIEGAAAGLYYLQVIHNGSRFTEKIIVK
ncbi:MAG: lamin tail domain-containing protein, partial [Bacteroidales bacterium]|nr:lamin tail domain-containing protein [Bacteroidales bacterium]